ETTTPQGAFKVQLASAEMTPDGGGGGTVAGVSVEPFPEIPYDLTLVDNPALNTAISHLKTDPALKDLCLAVIDLSGTPSYAGFTDAAMLYVGSLQKISAMYAAFELRSRVRKHVRAAVDAGITMVNNWRQVIINNLKTVWQPKLNRAFPSLPSGFPKLDEIFMFSSTGDVDFRSSGETQAQLDAISEGAIANLSFLECLKLMVRWSDNHAAARCILALSYPYINGALGAAEFFSPASSGTPARGLWLSGNYDNIHKDWLDDPTVNDARAGQPKTPRWVMGRPKTNFAATARQVARLMALIELDKLVDAEASAEMRTLLSAAELNTLIPLQRNQSLSYVELALREAGRSFDKVFSKIGIGDDGSLHDCAIVERTTNDSMGDFKNRYAVAGLGAPNNLDLILKLFVEVDKAI